MYIYNLDQAKTNQIITMKLFTTSILLGARHGQGRSDRKGSGYQLKRRELTNSHLSGSGMKVLCSNFASIGEREKRGECASSARRGSCSRI